MTTTLQQIQAELTKWSDMLRDHTTNDRHTREDVAAEIGGGDGAGGLFADVLETIKAEQATMDEGTRAAWQYIAAELPKYYGSLRDHRGNNGRAMRDWIAEEMVGKPGQGDGMTDMIAANLAAPPPKAEAPAPPKPPEAEKPSVEAPKQRPTEPASRQQPSRRY